MWEYSQICADSARLDWSQIVLTIAAVGAFLSAIAAWVSVREMVKDRFEQLRPYVVVAIDTRPDGALVLSARNYGRGLAEDIKISGLNPLVTDEGDRATGLSQEAAGEIHAASFSLAPGQTHMFFLALPTTCIRKLPIEIEVNYRWRDKHLSERFLLGQVSQVLVHRWSVEESLYRIMKALEKQ